MELAKTGGFVMEYIRKNVLCVDGDGEVCKLLSGYFPLLRFTFARSYESGLRLIQSSVFDLYLLDEFLPERSGAELCRDIRRVDANTPVVLLSRAGSPGNR